MTGSNGALALPMSGSLPPDLQGTLFRAGPAWPWGSWVPVPVPVLVMVLLLVPAGVMPAQVA